MRMLKKDDVRASERRFNKPLRGGFKKPLRDAERGRTVI
jgi:hypothetical protein